ncbi:MAG: hypothetical protein NXH86_09010 [Flavobacteriaceae bacterium]|jgi:mannitol-specific phosphotransferase system IIBC component|uniref:hypothetical protein n=1 Tax=Flagellimonas TaxID=444459 RepID=UPI000E25EF2D|nr:hypothetical protein [Flavobacteriaceae bacterium]
MFKRFTKKDDRGKERLNMPKIVIFSLVLVVFLWALTFVIFIFLPPDNPGVVGDAFGIINALFSALAFAFLIYTSLLQTEELKLQREELRESRKQYEEMVQAQKLQAEILRNQFDFEKDLQLNQFAPNLKLDFDNIKLEVTNYRYPSKTMSRVSFLISTSSLPAFMKSVRLMDENQNLIQQKELGYEVVPRRNEKSYFEIEGYPKAQMYLIITYQDVKKNNYSQTVKFLRQEEDKSQYDSIIISAENRES